MNDVLTADELSKEGKQAFQSGNYNEAADLFNAAADAYKLSGNMNMSTEMLNNSSVSYLQANEAEKAFQMVNPTIEVFREDGDRLKLAMAYGNRAAANEALKKTTDAITDYEKASEIFKELGESDLRLNVMQALSGLQLKSGRSLEAMATMEAGVAGVQKPTLKQRLLKKLLKTPFKLLNR